MKKLVWGLVATGMLIGAATAADAAQGCGPGWHRGPYGRCHPDRRPVYIAPGPVAIGVFYPGRGWWDGHRYWGHRYRWHGGWRYR
ncbi:hypothetical protein F9288_07395 [Sphingomonas sp. CL5.1]|uniref:GCG_CRPN prefix-to-repeats domain-containing protein n=1 Tax=Sphingomonas sp. CL5.1 TaxID=2653203 RepID=UPI0015817A5A|nr:hypothetical protein [Sphingomonas sp. CL5.1]QKR99486.1 hypothetical protein F9288_07395 [Sphingomonas sp. CL5.1]